MSSAQHNKYLLTSDAPYSGAPPGGHCQHSWPVKRISTLTRRLLRVSTYRYSPVLTSTHQSPVLISTHQYSAVLSGTRRYSWVFIGTHRYSSVLFKQCLHLSSLSFHTAGKQVSIICCCNISEFCKLHNQHIMSQYLY